jgi:2'-5' RNA ligase
MTNPDVQRLFLAVWPNEATRAALVDLQKRFPPGIGRSVNGDNLHITLVFLGAAAEERRQCVEQVMTKVHSPAFSFTLDQLGYWRKPQVLWAGSTDTSSSLLGLAESARHLAEQCGFTIEERPFQAHLTLFRKVRKTLRDLPTMIPIPWAVTSFTLVESITASSGVHYNVLRSWALSSAATDSTSG